MKPNSRICFLLIALSLMLAGTAPRAQEKPAAPQPAKRFQIPATDEGWAEDFSAWFPGLKIANRGISGDTSRGVLIRLHEDVLALDPEAVVLLIGTNDLEEKASPETVAANLKLILAELARHEPKIPIVLCQVFPSSAAKSRPSDQIKKLNQLYAAIVKGNAQVTLIETWLLFADAKGDAI